MGSDTPDTAIATCYSRVHALALAISPEVLDAPNRNDSIIHWGITLVRKLNGQILKTVLPKKSNIFSCSAGVRNIFAKAKADACLLN